MSQRVCVVANTMGRAEREDEAGKQEQEKTGKLTNPLVWVDLEMTGEEEQHAA